jgi:hypothetical protein
VQISDNKLYETLNQAFVSSNAASEQYSWRSLDLSATSDWSEPPDQPGRPKKRFWLKSSRLFPIALMYLRGLRTKRVMRPGHAIFTPGTACGTRPNVSIGSPFGAPLLKSPLNFVLAIIRTLQRFSRIIISTGSIGISSLCISKPLRGTNGWMQLVRALLIRCLI